MERIVSVSTNRSLYKPNESDIHAEIAALGQAASAGRATADCSAYITMPPCRKCFGALLVAGVTRIVSSYQFPNYLTEVAATNGIEMQSVDDVKKQRARVAEIVRRYESQQQTTTASTAAEDLSVTETT